MANPPPLEQARRWWKERTDAERYVVSPAEAPSLAAVRRTLAEEAAAIFGIAIDPWVRDPATLFEGSPAADTNSPISAP